MPTGKVRFYDDEKGFGFITTDEGQDVFLHATALPAGAAVKQGTRLEFGLADGKRGPQALSARVLEAPVSLSKAQRRPADLHPLAGRPRVGRHARNPPRAPAPALRDRPFPCPVVS